MSETITVADMGDYLDYMKSNEPNAYLNLSYGDGKTLDIDVKEYIPVDDQIRAMKAVRDYVFVGETYNPEFEQMAVGSVIIRYFTDLPIEEYIGAGENGYERMSEFVARSGIVDAICDSCRAAARFRENTYAMISFEIDRITNKSAVDDLLGEVKGLVSAITSKIQNASDDDIKSVMSPESLSKVVDMLGAKKGE